jgi:large subunit ribosomal protein L24
MQKIKSKDQVIILTGKDKGKTGTVLKIIDYTNKIQTAKGVKANRVIVEGLNMIKKHVKANPSQEKPGGIIEKEASIDISNVALVNPNTGKADKVGFKILEAENRKVRVFKSTGEVVDV